MASWKRICCPVDFSAASRTALMEAARTAKGAGAELVVLAVAEARRSKLSTDALVSPPELFEAEREEARRQLRGWVEEAGVYAPGLVRGEARVGDPAEEVLRFVREGGFDLVAMGTHGRKGIRRLVLGSVAEKVVREAPCSVLVVRPEREEPVVD